MRWPAAAGINWALPIEVLLEDLIEGIGTLGL